MEVVNLYQEKAAEITDVLHEAFYEYPVMEYVLGNEGNYDNRLRKLVGFFVGARALRKEPMLGIYNSKNKLVAAAVVTLPGDIPQPEELLRRREILWSELGSTAKVRYGNYGKTAFSLLPQEPHHHLNMIGVRTPYMGRGLARQLITAVEELVMLHPSSTGVSLNTEVETNINFYLHLGYKLIGQTNVDKNIETWGFFKSMK
jgi:GNAT superfamily N-acetyltransferase